MIASCAEQADLLLVDDDPDYAESLADVLSTFGHHVRIATDGVQALVQMGSKLPDAVLLDIDMPRLNGRDVALRMFMEDAGRERIPIVFVSANVELSRIAADVGTTYFMPKPFDLQDFFSLLWRVLEERTAPRWPAVSPSP